MTRVSHPHQQKEANYKDCKDRLQETGSSGATVKIKARGQRSPDKCEASSGVIVCNSLLINN